jgi:serine phosphatase RsbU (regulator of sigma subunit)
VSQDISTSTPQVTPVALRTFENAVSTLNVGICVWQLEEPDTPASLRLVICNPAAAKFMAVKLEDVLHKRIAEGFPGSLEMPLAGLFTRIAQTGQSMALGDVPYVDEIVPASVFSIHAHAMPDRRVCVEFTNVTEQRAAERKIAEQHGELTRALNDLWGEMDLARKIQTVLLPNAPEVAGYEVAGEVRAASTVGGDYFDVIEVDGSTWLLIGDVSGHGVSAGLIMMMTQTAVRTAIESTRGLAEPVTPSRVLSLVNTAIRGNLAKIGRDQYMTINAICLRDGRALHAGLHQDLLVYRAATGQIDTFETDGVWLGVVDDAAPLLKDASFHLDPGDVLLAFSDGLVETRLPEGFFGQARLAARFGELASAGASAPAIVTALLDAVGGVEAKDDLTVLVARRQATRSR